MQVNIKYSSIAYCYFSKNISPIDLLFLFIFLEESIRWWFLRKYLIAENRYMINSVLNVPLSFQPLELAETIQ